MKIYSTMTIVVTLTVDVSLISCLAKVWVTTLIGLSYWGLNLQVLQNTGNLINAVGNVPLYATWVVFFLNDHGLYLVLLKTDQETVADQKKCVGCWIESPFGRRMDGMEWPKWEDVYKKTNWLMVYVPLNLAICMFQTWAMHFKIGSHFLGPFRAMLLLSSCEMAPHIRKWWLLNSLDVGCKFATSI